MTRLFLALILSLPFQVQAFEVKEPAEACSCKIEITEPKAFEGANCPKDYVATGVASVRPPKINCSQVVCKCHCSEDEKNE